MNPFWMQVVIQTTLKKKKQKNNKSSQPVYSGYVLARGYREFIISLKRLLFDIILIGTGVFSAAFGLKGFLLTNHFIDGGVTGVSLLISALSDIPVYILIFCINVPFVLLAFKVAGKRFAIRTGAAITAFSLVLAFVSFPDVTKDNLLVAIFGGFFLGAGIGFAVRGGAVIDGTEVLAIYLSRKLSATMGDVVLVINVIIFSTAAYFLGVEIALYSMITYFSAGRTLDFIVEGFEEYIGVTVVSIRSNEIRQMITQKLGRGVTVYKGSRGMGKRGESREIDIVYSVITRLETGRLNTEIEKIDPNAFVVMSRVKDTRGGMVKRRPLDF